MRGPSEAQGVVARVEAYPMMAVWYLGKGDAYGSAPAIELDRYSGALLLPGESAIGTDSSAHPGVRDGRPFIERGVRPRTPYKSAARAQKGATWRRAVWPFL